MYSLKGGEGSFSLSLGILEINEKNVGEKVKIKLITDTCDNDFIWKNNEN